VSGSEPLHCTWTEIDPELGFLLSKGSNGIKKDMKEAAKWYRMAVSDNLFGNS
jgi:hypothetical protein